MKMAVAVKKSFIPRDDYMRDGDDIISLEEVRFMARMQHDHIVRLIYYYISPTKNDTLLCLNEVFELFEGTLSDYLVGQAEGKKMTMDQTCTCMYQLCLALGFLRIQRVCHRDVKPQNMLLDSHKWLLKLADFGSAKTFRQPGIEQHTAYQITRYYRPPEMLLGNPFYTHAVDMWSAGCVFAEMITGRIFFHGHHQTHQMRLIQDVLGKPGEDDLQALRSDIDEVPLSLEMLTDAPRRMWSEVLQGCYVDGNMISLLSDILQYSPSRRPNGYSACMHACFTKIRSALLAEKHPAVSPRNVNTEYLSTQSTMIDGMTMTVGVSPASQPSDGQTKIDGSAINPNEKVRLFVEEGTKLVKIGNNAGTAAHLLTEEEEEHAIDEADL